MQHKFLFDLTFSLPPRPSPYPPIRRTPSVCTRPKKNMYANASTTGPVITLPADPLLQGHVQRCLVLDRRAADPELGRPGRLEVRPRFRQRRVRRARHPRDHRAPQSLKSKERKGLTPMSMRGKARDFALKTIGEQAEQFKRYGVWGDYDRRYQTLDPEYEAMVLFTSTRYYSRRTQYAVRVQWTRRLSPAFS